MPYYPTATIPIGKEGLKVKKSSKLWIASFACIPIAIVVAFMMHATALVLVGVGVVFLASTILIIAAVRAQKREGRAGSQRPQPSARTYGFGDALEILVPMSFPLFFIMMMVAANFSTSPAPPPAPPPEALSISFPDIPSKGYGALIFTSGTENLKVSSSGWANGIDGRAGTTFEVTASPDDDSVFVGWSGACSGKGHCTVTLGKDKELGATFSKKKPPKKLHPHVPRG